MSYYYQIFKLFSQDEKKKFFLLLFFIIIMALLDTLGIASILPFMAILTNPNIIETNIILNFIYNKFNFQNHQSFLFMAGIFVFLALFISLLFKTITTYILINFTYGCEYKISKKFMENYLNQSYCWFLNRNSADLGKNLLSEINLVTNQSIMPALNLISQGMVAISIIILILIIDFFIATVLGVFLSSSYYLIIKSSKSYLKKIGNSRLTNNKDRFLIINEAFNAIKEIKISNYEKKYIDSFNIPAKAYSENLASAQILARLPRYALEAVSFGGILSVTLFLMTQNSNFVNIIPILAFFTFAGYRLIPALQQIYSSITQMRYSKSALDAIVIEYKKINIDFSKSKEKIVFKNEIVLNNISYKYKDDSSLILNNVNIKIKNNSSVAFVGPTGCGKSTLIDIINGLLIPTDGQIVIDETILSKKNVSSWQSQIAYVPQNVYLKDDTIISNIAFGDKAELIDTSLVEKVSKLAQIDDFIFNQLPEGYKTNVGERGVRLSGGQKQRLGLARALYKNPKILILDEATSALDYETEKKVMESINDLKEKMLIIMISHRSNSITNCDKVFTIKNGVVSEKEFKNLQNKFDDQIKEL